MLRMRIRAIRAGTILEQIKQKCIPGAVGKAYHAGCSGAVRIVAVPNFDIDPTTAEPAVLASVRAYWERRRGPRAMPGRRDIVPSDLKAHLPHILLADVIDGGRDFRYRLVGSQLQDYFAGNPTGKLMRETLAPFGAETVAQTLAVYRAAVKRRAPMRVRGAGSYYAQGPKLFDALLTPLADDGVAPNMILGAFLFVWDTNMEFARPRAAEHDIAALKAALADRA